MLNRSQEIDIAKGMGILFVVLGHNWLVLHEKGYLYQAIYSFHMPLFFLLSGVFLRSTDNILRTFKTKAVALLKPYLVVNVGLALFLLFSKSPLTTGGWFGILYANGNSLVFGWLWFLPSLFATTLFSMIFIRIFGDNQIVRQFWFVLCVLLITLGFLLLRMSSDNFNFKFYIQPNIEKNVTGLPFGIDLLPITGAFMLAGYFLSEKLRHLSHSIYLLIASIFIFILITIFSSSTIDLNERIYDSLVISTSKAILGIYIIFQASLMICQSLPSLARVLAYLGSGSLFIFIFHGIIQGKVTFKLFKIFPNFVVIDSILGLIASVFISIFILEIAKKTSVLSLLFFPSKSSLLAKG